MTRGVPVWQLAAAGLIGALLGLAATRDALFPATPIVACVLFAVLGVLAIIDARTSYLPDPWMITAGAVVALHPIIIGATSELAVGVFFFLLAAVGASIGFCLFAITRMVTRGQLGFGDVKLAAVLGGWLLPFGWQALGVAAVLTAIIGALWMMVALSRGRRAAPYGPAMIAGAILATGLI